MKRTLSRSLLVATMTSLLFSATVFAGFDEAMQAYQSGDRATAFNLMQEAAVDGDERAYGKLGSYFLYGIGTEKDYPEAYAWFGLAKEAGDKYAEGFMNTAASAMDSASLEKAEKRLKTLKEALGL